MLSAGIDYVRTYFGFLHGIGGYAVFYLISVAFACAYLEKENAKQLLINYFVVAVIFIYNPIVAYIVHTKFNEGIYYILLWCLPVGLSIAYMFTDMLFFSESKFKTIIGFFAIAALLCYAGNYMYKAEYFSKRENCYSVKDNQLEIVEYILKNKDSKEVKVFFEPEMNAIARMMDSSIITTYYKLDDGTYAGNYNVLRYINETYEYEKVEEELINLECKYFVWNNKELEFSGAEKLNKVFENDKYQIYEINDIKQ